MKSTVLGAIVIVMIDDQGLGDLACHTHPLEVGVPDTIFHRE